MDREIVVFPLLDTVIGKLNSISDAASAAAAAGHEFPLIERRLADLRFSINQITEVVVVAERKFFLKEIGNGEWLEEVQEAAYDADDLLDLIIAKRKLTFLSDILGQRPVPYMAATAEVLTLFCLPGRLDNLVSKLEKVKKLSQRFNRLWKDGNGLFTCDSIKAGLLIRAHSQSRFNPIVQAAEEMMPNNIFGREADKKGLLDMLIHRNSELQLSVIPIVGEIGVGKTTLARMVYDDEKVLAHFDLRAWVSIDAEYDAPNEFIAGKIGKGIVESVTGLSCRMVRMDELDELVRDTLEAKRSLIVLAGLHFMSRDIWLHLVEAWFPIVAPGSSVIVVTSSRKVADVMATNESYKLNALSVNDSWDMFNQLAFGSLQVKECRPEIMSVARKIVDRCLGNPVFLNLLGSLMRFRKTKEEWLCIQDCFEKLTALPWEACSVTPMHSDVHNVLSVCYHYLPPHLKRCFVYCSIFPKDGVLEKEKLIQMWIAEGLVQSAGGKGALEDIGNSYFQQLLCRSFFTDAKWDEYGETTACRMHPLIQDLARLVAGFDNVVKEGVGCRQSRKFRQVSLAFDSQSSSISKALDPPKNLRTLLLLWGSFGGTLGRSFFRLKSLRVLDLSSTGIQKLSNDIHNLQHLRYLDLSHTLIERLPYTVTHLKYLQTLRLSSCSHLQELPKKLQNMTELRHLDVSLCHSLSHMPSGIGLLTSLQSLPVFVLGKTKGSAHLGELHRLNLRGKLEIRNLENVTCIAEARGARLYEKENLHHLVLSWDPEMNRFSKMSSDLLLESLWPHPNLKVLDITGYNGSKFPSWMRDSSIHNLAKVFINNCSCKELPPLGQLPYLKELFIRGMNKLQTIGSEFYGDDSVTRFPSLQHIELSNMPLLVEWSNLAPLEESTTTTVEQAFPCLNAVTVQGCPELRSFPFLPALKNLVLRKSNKMLLRSLANLTSFSSLVINEYELGLPLDLRNSKSIEKLMIHRCGFFDYPFELGMQGLSSVKELGILYCHELTSLPIRLRYLTSLEKLDIIECHNLKLIPYVKEWLPSLRELIIEGCPLLASLPKDVENLTSLQKLIIKGCPALSYLPEGLKDISGMQYLLISGCPNLTTRLEKDKGEDWFKIAHVPCIIIGLQGCGKTTEDNPSELRIKEEKGSILKLKISGGCRVEAQGSGSKSFREGKSGD